MRTYGSPAAHMWRLSSTWYINGNEVSDAAAAAATAGYLPAVRHREGDVSCDVCSAMYTHVAPAVTTTYELLCLMVM